MLPLDTFREILGYHPWHFWQLASNDIAGLAVASKCNTVVYEHSWQSNSAGGREQIRDGIETAERRLFEYLYYRVNPQYVEKTFQYPRPADRRMQWLRPADASGRWLSINAREGFIREIGTKAFEDLGDQTIAYSDSFGGGLNDTFTVTATVAAGTDPDSIEVYFVSSDRLDGAGLIDRWRVAPVNVSISGTTATITGRSWLLVQPVLYEAWNAQQLDPTVSGNFVTELSVQRRYTETDGTTPQTAQAMLIWETDPPYSCCPCITCNTSPQFDPYDQDPAAEAYALARAVIRDGRAGEIAVGESVYDSTNDRFVGVNWGLCRQPDRVQIRYYAGAQASEVDDGNYLAGSWDRTIARLAMAEMAPSRICACDNANQQLWRWQFDRARAAGVNDEQYSISKGDLGNPFGTFAGQIYAWNQVKNLALVSAFTV